MNQTRRLSKLLSTTSLSLSLALGSVPGLAQTAPDGQAPPPPPPVQAPAAEATPPAAESPSPEALNQAVAPVALYPDALVSQILAAAEVPSQAAQAEAWLTEHPGLGGAALAQAVNGQPWDPSVKALAQFPTVLADMNRNLAWATALGVDYQRQPQAVLAAVQAMRARAQQAGTLTSSAQQRVTASGSSVVIEPANPQVVYVPAYDPWAAYGPPVPAYPGWVDVPGAYVGGPGLVFGVGVGLAAFAAFGWGWHHWGADWGHRTAWFNHRGFVHGPGFAARGVGRPGFGRAGFARPGPARFAAHRPGGFARHGAGGFQGGGFRGGFHGGGFHGGGRR
jgi:uncharacterized membrane protein YgcG